MSVFDKYDERANAAPGRSYACPPGADEPPYLHGAVGPAKPSLESQAGDALQELVARYDREVSRHLSRIAQLEEQLGNAHSALAQFTAYAKSSGPGGSDIDLPRPKF